MMQLAGLYGRHLGMVCLFWVLFSVTAHSQVVPPDTTSLYRIQTLDGNEYIGAILEQNEEFILLRTQTLGDITIARKDIRSMAPVLGKQVIGGDIWLENPQSTRYFWSPNGYGLRRGEGYYQNVWILFNQASVGLTDHVSLGLGTVPLFLFAGASSPVWITPKVSIPVSKDKLALGAGGLLGTVIGETDTGFGILYGIGTLGSRDKNVSLGVGYAFAGGEWANAPVFTLSGMLRIGKNGYLLTENYIISAADEQLALIMLGGRSIIRKVGLDYGLVIPAATDLNTFVGLPWLGLTVPFGTKPAASTP